MKDPFTEEQKIEYIQKNGNCCPDCGINDVQTVGPIESDAGIAWQSCWCEHCGAEWSDEYKLVNIERDEE